MPRPTEEDTQRRRRAAKLFRIFFDFEFGHSGKDSEIATGSSIHH
jgi:hypothetical protein